jgi:integrase
VGNVLEFDSGRPSGNSSAHGAKGGERAPKSRPGQGASGQSKLTQRLVNEIRPPPSGKLRLPDGEIHGLFLRVTPKGAKSFILRYSMDGRRGEATIGDARSITLVAARAKAVDVLSDLAVRKVDPVHARKAAIREEKAKKEENFASLVARYQQDAARRKRANTLAYEAWLFEKHVLPKLGERRYADLRRAEIIAMIEKVGTSAGPTTANRAHAIVRQVLNFALKRDLIEANPALAIDRVFQEKSRDRVLSETEIQRLWSFLEAARRSEGTGILKDEAQGERAINGLSAPTAIALELCLLTLQRAGEVAGARIEEFNWTDRLWVVPAERMKGKRAHAVPLSGLAMARFQEAFQRSGGKFAFVDRTGGNSLDPKRLTRAMNRACRRIDIMHASPHDLRRTGRTMMTSERVGVTYEVAERVIAHLVGSAVSRVYDRNEYLKEKRAALDMWAASLAKLVQKDNAVQV